MVFSDNSAHHVWWDPKVSRNIFLKYMLIKVHLCNSLSSLWRNLFQLSFLKFAVSSRLRLYSLLNLTFQQTLFVIFGSWMWNCSPSNLLVRNCLERAGIRLIQWCFLHDPLTNLCGHSCPYFQLLTIHLIYLRVKHGIVSLPNEGIKSCLKSWHTIDFDLWHLLKSILDVCNHIEWPLHIFSIINDVNHSTPAQVFELFFYVLLGICMYLFFLLILWVFFLLLSRLLSKERRPHIQDGSNHYNWFTRC